MDISMSYQSCIDEQKAVYFITEVNTYVPEPISRTA